jgi:hypothetical protein
VLNCVEEEGILDFRDWETDNNIWVRKVDESG